MINNFKIFHIDGPCSTPGFMNRFFSWETRRRIVIATNEKIRMRLFGFGADFAIDATGSNIREWISARGTTLDYQPINIMFGGIVPQGYVDVDIMAKPEDGLGDRTIKVKWLTGDELIRVKIVANCDEVKNTAYRNLTPTDTSEDPVPPVPIGGNTVIVQSGLFAIATNATGPLIGTTNARVFMEISNISNNPDGDIPPKGNVEFSNVLLTNSGTRFTFTNFKINFDLPLRFNANQSSIPSTNSETIEVHTGSSTVQWDNLSIKGDGPFGLINLGVFGHQTISYDVKSTTRFTPPDSNTSILVEMVSTNTNFPFQISKITIRCESSDPIRTSTGDNRFNLDGTQITFEGLFVSFGV